MGTRPVRGLFFFFSLRVLHKEQWLETCERLQSPPSQQYVGRRNLPRHRPAYLFWVPYVYTSRTSLRRAAAVVSPPSVRTGRRVPWPNGGSSCRLATELGNGEESSNCCQSECSRLLDSRTRIGTGDSLVVDILPTLVERTLFLPLSLSLSFPPSVCCSCPLKVFCVILSPCKLTLTLLSVLLGRCRFQKP